MMAGLCSSDIMLKTFFKTRHTVDSLSNFSVYHGVILLYLETSIGRTCLVS